jgi:thiamine-monophosphate kinase
MREDKLIATILSNFKRSKDQKNEPFACDAEIVSIGGKLWGITIDEFSAEEDMFANLQPFDLGHNLAAAVLSDLFACGAKPQFFMHSLVLGENTDANFIDELVKGISSVLDSANCFLLGGDTGCGQNWRYTGVAMGPVCSDNYISRILPQKDQSIWVTGSLGDANFSAFTNSTAPLFELRLDEACYIRKNATSCIDTSGGFVDSLWVLKTLNKNLHFQIDTPALPIDKEAINFCIENKLPPQALLFGGAGEYELVFTTPVDVIPTIQATRIGTVCPSKQPGLFFDLSGRSVEITQPPACPREIRDRTEYIQTILKQVNDVFG